MIGKEYLSKYLKTHTAEECYNLIHWLMRDYGMQYTDTRLAVINWLDEDQPMCNPADVAENMKNIKEVQHEQDA